jgi:hypothetical protein
MRVLLLVLVPQTNLLEDGSRGTPTKLSQSRVNVGDGPGTNILMLVGWLKAGLFRCDGVDDAIVAGFTDEKSARIASMHGIQYKPTVIMHKA